MEHLIETADQSDISSFHGPWLQLPPEILESLAYSNYETPRPRPIDPAVFFDIVKVRRLVEEATDLTVRAANGTTSSALGGALGAANGMMGGGSAAALGLGIGGSGPGAKLSRERKHRMREHATQKLSHAYHLDEIAASVATMQGASSLEDVAKLVLQRNANNNDAKYVHFFHEKIPSRMLAQSTSLQALSDIIHDMPTEPAALRTRAVTRIFKDDYDGAARDLSEALAISRYTAAQHKTGRGQLELANTLGTSERKTGSSSRRPTQIDEADQPTGLEAQLLFQRAGVYLSIACQSVHLAIDGIPSEANSLGEEGHQATTYDLAARKAVKTNAKRALRDYIGFLSLLEYTPGLPAGVTAEFLTKVNAIAGGHAKPKASSQRRIEAPQDFGVAAGDPVDSLVTQAQVGTSGRGNGGCSYSNAYPSFPSAEIHTVAALFSSSPPANLPPFPDTSSALVTSRDAAQQRHAREVDNRAATHTEQPEAVTYHPLLTDALHSLLLCHALMQTSPKELLRHANMVARLARVCDGYPIFLASRSPSRADWIEVLQRADNWLGLQLAWEDLCAPAPLPGQTGYEQGAETEDQARERRRQEAIMEALADERVHDQASFQAAVDARQRRTGDQQSDQSTQNGSSPKRWAQGDGKEYPTCTDRAAAVARWVREAPLTVPGAAKAKRGSKGRNRNEGGKHASELSESFASLTAEADKAGGTESTPNSNS